jgi:hypothetical protein
MWFSALAMIAGAASASDWMAGCFMVTSYDMNPDHGPAD